MNSRILAIVSLTAALAACGEDGAASGSGGDGGSGAGGTGGLQAPVCDEGFTPCGGDPVGAWTFDQVCGVAHRPLDLAAPDACQDLPSSWTTTLEGQLDFRADGTLVEAYEGEQTLAMEIPVACLEGLEVGPARETCLATGRTIVEREGGSGGCAFTDGLCRCEITVPGTFARTRTWEVRDGTLAIGGGLGGPVEYELCVGAGYLVRRQDDGQGGHVVDVLARVP